ncbi:MAG: phospholipid carrier-dependent glycosyltransferase [Eubacterium sp.]
MVEKFYQLSKKEIIFLVVVIFLYGILGYWNLGSCSAPETYYKIESETDSAEFKVNEQPTSILLYAPVNDSTKYIGLKISCSSDGINWTSAFDTRTDDKDYTAAMIWYNYPLETNIDTHYIKIEKLETANRLVLSEVAFKNAADTIIEAEPLNEGSTLLMDEPETIQLKSDRLNSAYFDESQDGLNVAEMDHPPVGRLIIGLGMTIFGRNPFGFRSIQVFFGIMMLPLLYFFSKALFKSSKWAGFTMLILALDFMHYTQTRIGTLDAFLVFFILGMYSFLYFYHINTHQRARYVLLLISGIFTGLAIGTKWSGCYAALGLAILYFYWTICGFVKGDISIKKMYIKETLWCCLCFLVFPIIIYAISYIPYALTIPDQSFFKTFIEHQQQMLGYHTGDSTHYHHPYSSKWWTWIVALKPVFYYYQAQPVTIYLYGTGNPLIWGIGFLGVIFAGIMTFLKKSDSGMVIVIGYFSQLIPWLFITRDTFLYHYFPMVPFLILGLSYLLKNIGNTPKYYQIKQGYALLFLIVAFVCFIMAFPFIYGSPMEWSTVLWLRQFFLIIMGIMFFILLIIGVLDLISEHSSKL